MIRKSSFWSVNNKSSLGSWTWKKLPKCRPIAEKLTKAEIQSGSCTLFSFDVWCPLGKLIDLVGTRGCIDLGVNVESTVEEAIQSYRTRRHRTENLKQIEREVMLLRERGLTTFEDVRLWKGNGDVFRNTFSTKDTRKLVRSPSPRRDWHKGIRFTFATPKFTFITWITLHNRISTGDRMMKWNQQVNSGCVLCNARMEIRDHLFFKCLYSSEVWKGLTLNMLGPHYSCDWSTLFQMMVAGGQDKIDLFLLRYKITVYSIWKERNGRRHGDKPQTGESLCRHIDKSVRNRISTIRMLGSKGYEEAMRRWFASR